jgi:hypothetical protein
MQRPDSGTETARRFDEIAQELAGRGVSVAKMFGMPCYKARGKAIAGLWGDALVFKLPPDAVASTLKMKGAELFDPGMGRPMREWVVVPAPHAKHWRRLAETALEYIPRDKA